MTATLTELGTAFVLVAVLGTAMSGAARAAPDPKAAAADGPAPSALDVEARDRFRSQRYADALAIYQRLRVETNHPTYLRNIGRCHQMMRQPAPAIDAFQAYLREARDLGPVERTEIEGYIAEMQRLELSSPPPSSSGAPEATTRSTASPPATAGAPSIARQWWFWTGIGILAAATGIILVASTSGQDRSSLPHRRGMSMRSAAR